MFNRILRPFWPLFTLLPLALWIVFNPQWNQVWFLEIHHATGLIPAPVWRLISIFGDWPTILALLLALSWRQAEHVPAFILGCGFIIFCTTALKMGFAVQRPFLVLPASEVQLLSAIPKDASFPSGHATAAATLASFLYYSKRWPHAGSLILGVALVMLSRLAIGVHWPLDVLVGALIGWLLMRFAVLWVWQTWSANFTRWAQNGLLLVLAANLVRTALHPAVYEEHYVRLAITALVIAAGVWRWLRKST